MLIETTELAFSDVAFAAGFESIRQFNDTVREVFASSPTQLRTASTRRRSGSPESWISLRLGVREPFAVDQVWDWLASHAIEGVEEVDGAVFRRSLRLPGGSGVVELEPVDPASGSGWIEARYRLDDFADLASAVQSSRRLLDLDADPNIIDLALTADPALAPLVASQPGLRSPGDVSGSDATIRAVLHQQVSVASARAMASRLVRTFGEPLANPVGTVTSVFPPADVWAAIDPDDLGLTKARAATLVRVAAAVAEESLDVSPLADRSTAREQLLAIKGIGPWTASIVALRGLADPDAFTTSDLALNRVAAKLGLAGDAAGMERASRSWRPWRSYAMHHLWRHYMTEPTSGAATPEAGT